MISHEGAPNVLNWSRRNIEHCWLSEGERKMHVGTVVTGHFMKAGEQLHITLEAIDVETNEILWRDQINTPAQSMITTQAQIQLKVRRGLSPILGVSPPEPRTQPKNEEAYDLVLRASALLFDLKSNRTAIQMLEKAVQLDPSYAPAWHVLSRAYSQEDHYTKGGRGWTERSEGANDRALALDPDY